MAESLDYQRCTPSNIPNFYKNCMAGVIFYPVFSFPGVVKMVGFCQITAWISGFQVALRIGRVVRLSEMYTLLHTKFLPKLHGWVIFYQVFSFPGVVKMVVSVK